jgi:hypothetical protein
MKENMKQVYAYTEPKGPFPAYVNFSERSAGVVALTVRTAGNGGCNVATIDLDRNELKALAGCINAYLGTSVQEFTEEESYDSGLTELRKMTALLQQQVDLMEASRDDHREAMVRYDVMTSAYRAFTTEPINAEAVSTASTTFTFDQFVQYGRDNGGNIVGGMPWSFSFHGHPVTHENDHRYIIGNGTLDGLNFTDDDVLVVNADGALTTLRAETPAG